MKEIWKKFKEDLSYAWNTFKEGISGVCGSTFKILKDGCVNFVKAIFTWIFELAQGICLVAWSLLQAFWAAFSAAFKATLGYAYNKLVDWIVKW